MKKILRIVALILLAAVLVSGCQAGREGDSLNAGSESTAPLQTEPSQPAQTDAIAPTQPKQPDPKLPELPVYPIDVMLEGRIYTEYCRIMGISVYNLSVQCYWQDGDTYVVYVDGYWSYKDTPTSEVIDSKEIILPSKKPLYVYRLGSLYRLNSKTIHTFDFDAFYAYHKEQYADVYASLESCRKTDLDCPALLTAEKRTELDTALGLDGYFCTDSLWFGKDNPLSLYRFYGSDNGYDIVFYDSETEVDAPEQKQIGEVVFEHGNPFRLYACKDGVLADLKDVYAEGLIGKEALVKAGEYHAQCEKAYSDWEGTYIEPVDFSLLTQEERDTVILKAFCRLTGNDYDAIGSKLSVRHYWNSGVAYVFFVDGLEEYEDIITCTRANFRDFILPTTQPLYFYQEGKCYTLSNSRNMLPWPMEERDGYKVSAVEVFLEFHKTQYPELYDPANWPAKSALNCPVYLSSEKRMEIENYFIQKSQEGAYTWNHYNTDGLWYSEKHPNELRYYGNYEGYDFLFVYSMMQASQSETFGNIVFESNVQFSFYIYKDGETMPVTEAYEQGLISDEAIAQVAELHKQHGGKVEKAE